MAHSTNNHSTQIPMMNDLFRNLHVCKNDEDETVSDEVKIFQCEQSDETSSINSALSAMTLRSIQSNRSDNGGIHIDRGGDIQQRVNRIRQLANTRKQEAQQQQQQHPIENNNHSHQQNQQNRNNSDDDEYDEEKGAQILKEMIASVLKPKSKQKEAFIQNINFKPESTATSTLRWQQQQEKKSTVTDNKKA